MRLVLLLAGSLYGAAAAAWGAREGAVRSLQDFAPQAAAARSPALTARRRRAVVAKAKVVNEKRTQPPQLATSNAAPPLCSAAHGFSGPRMQRCCTMYLSTPTMMLGKAWGAATAEMQAEWKQHRCDKFSVLLHVARTAQQAARARKDAAAVKAMGAALWTSERVEAALALYGKGWTALRCATHTAHTQDSDGMQTAGGFLAAAITAAADKTAGRSAENDVDGARWQEARGAIHEAKLALLNPNKVAEGKVDGRASGGCFLCIARYGLVTRQTPGLRVVPSPRHPFQDAGKAASSGWNAGARQDGALAHGTCSGAVLLRDWFVGPTRPRPGM